jgi:hypothetical protein
MGAFMGAAMVAVDGTVHGHLSWVGIIGAIVLAYRRQWSIDDKQYLCESRSTCNVLLRDMIPHHSMAILTSRPRVQSSDPRIARLAEQILVSQTREIAEMRHILRSS